MSIFQKASYTEKETGELEVVDESDMYFHHKNNWHANIAFMERELIHHQDMARQLKELLTEKKEIVKEKLQKLKEDKTLSKEEKVIKKRKILNTVF